MAIRRPRLLVTVGALLVLALIAAAVIVVVRVSGPRVEDSVTLANGARVDASSTAVGYSASSAVVPRDADQTKGWKSDDQTVGAWLALAWPRTYEVHSVTIQRSRTADPDVTSGSLTFGDGSAVRVVLARNSRTTTVELTPRMTRSVRFTAAEFSAGATATTIDRLAVNAVTESAVRDEGGDAVRTASIRASSGTDGKGLIKGGWVTPSPTATTIRFTWARPRELVSVRIAGAVGSSTTIARATLRFGSGGSIGIGAVPNDPDLPTEVAFMPHVVRSVVLVIDAVSGDGALALSSIRLGEQGVSTAPQPVLDGTTVTAVTADPCAGITAPAIAAATIRVLCPTNGSHVGDAPALVVALPSGATGVTAEVWPATGNSSVPAVTVTGSGVVRIPLQLGALPPGPVTVFLNTLGTQAAAVRFQLMHGRQPAERAPSSSAARGRTLVYDDEFTGPLSASRSGEGTRYSAGKPETDGVTDFGDAIFADPADGLGNIGVLDGQYLRVTVSPKPDGFSDPEGWKRRSVGGLIASARPGGSGFSAQYGYFEARMLAPAAPGTWPAFWLLPSTNLVQAQPAVAELDTVELYGHEPLGACETTHEYVQGSSNGKAQCGPRFTSARKAAQWHTYGVNVTPTQVVFFIDGRRVATASQVRGGGDPMFFLVDLALGGGWPVDLTGTDGRAQLLVDFVRVYV